MNALQKLCYLGPAQTARKYFLKAERRFQPACLKPPPLPAADNAIDRRVNLLGYEFDLRTPERWHRAPDTGRVWPLAYGPTIPLEAAGDVKLIWELNRHQFGPTREMIRDWIAQNPYPFGINWNSAMEVALRMIAWIERFGRDEFAGALAQHARFVRHNLSADWIPRGNHLVAEAAALSLYQQRPHRWLRQAAGEQFYPSGVHREQSVAYHHFVTHLFAIAGLPQPKALAYLGAIRQPDGSLPNIGDNDDGRASTQPLELPASPTSSVAFPDAGHYVIRNGGDYCFIRCGEFGPGHAHADLLAPVLWLRGEPLFIDPGTFTYNGDPAQRRYFRTTHNIVNDQGEPAGTFAWRNAPTGVCENWTGTDFTGSVGSWRRRVRHEPGRFIITDTLTGARRWRFHLHPRWKVSRCADGEFVFGNFRLKTPGQLHVGAGWYSSSYNQRIPIDVCEISMDASQPNPAEFIVE